MKKLITLIAILALLGCEKSWHKSGYMSECNCEFIINDSMKITCKEWIYENTYMYTLKINNEKVNYEMLNSWKRVGIYDVSVVDYNKSSDDIKSINQMVDRIEFIYENCIPLWEKEVDNFREQKLHSKSDPIKKKVEPKGCFNF